MYILKTCMTAATSSATVSREFVNTAAHYSSLKVKFFSETFNFTIHWLFYDALQLQYKTWFIFYRAEGKIIFNI